MGASGPDTALGPCTFCGGAARLGLEARDRNRELGDARFRYRRCERCDTLSLVDVPGDLARFYPQAERYYGLHERDALERLADAEEHKLALVRRHVPGGRLVEIGPGAGAFSYAARRAGFDVTAIEMDTRTCQHLREAIEVEVVNSDDPPAALAELPASRAIVMWHVLEHLADPAAAVDAAAANLEPGGVLAVSTPNPASLQLRVLGGRWAHVDAPRHLALVPLEALTQRAAAAGLRRVGATTSDPTGRDCNCLGWEYGLRRRPASGPPARPVLLATFALERALRPIEGRGLRGAAYTTVFVKDGPAAPCA